MSHHPHDEGDINDLGLQADLAMFQQRPVERRRILQLGLVGIGALLASCSNAARGSSPCVSEIPEETQGPYPADGSATMGGGGAPPGAPPTGGVPPTPGARDLSAMQSSADAVNVLTLSGIVRRDVRRSLGTGNTAEGVPTTLNLQLVNIRDGCKPLQGYALYIWHCNRAGEYSLYSEAVVDEDYLRGVQATDAEGNVSFKTIFPACYPGRWPHIHFEVYPSLEVATGAENKVNTSQVALPQRVCEAVYNTAAGYSQSVRNLAELSLDSDNVFGDGYASQLAAVTGSVEKGYTVTLQVGIAL